MGFYSPSSLTADARRHGVEVLRPDIQLSGADATLEPLSLPERPALSEQGETKGGAETKGTGFETAPAERLNQRSCTAQDQPPVAPYDRTAPFDTADHRRDGGFAVRLGLAAVTSIGARLADRIVAERDAAGPYLDLYDLARRVGLDSRQLEALSAAGAFESFGLSVREAIWASGHAAQERPDQLRGTVITIQPPLLPMLSAAEQVLSDLWSTGLSTDDHPIRHVRQALTDRGALSVAQLATAESGRRIELGGAVIHRQRPSTARGVTFLNIEDETGMVNVICTVGVWNRYRRVARTAPALVVRGMLERSEEGVINILADRFEPLPVAATSGSRDFQ
jgi:error-prone DNA polymerase